MTGGHSMTGSRAERGTSEYTVTIGARVAGGWSATETIKADGQRLNSAVTISDSGVWTGSDGSVLLNFISLDPRTVCVTKSTLATGDNWSCAIEGNHTRAAGTETVVVTSATSDRVVLDVTGSSPVAHTMRGGDGGAAPVQIAKRSWWHDTITFVRGQSVKIEHSIKHTTQFGTGGPIQTTTGSNVLTGH